jgi:hypothetical protein
MHKNKYIFYVIYYYLLKNLAFSGWNIIYIFRHT